MVFIYFEIKNKNKNNKNEINQVISFLLFLSFSFIFIKSILWTLFNEFTGFFVNSLYNNESFFYYLFNLFYLSILFNLSSLFNLSGLFDLFVIIFLRLCLLILAILFLMDRK